MTRIEEVIPCHRAPRSVPSTSHYNVSGQVKGSSRQHVHGYSRRGRDIEVMASINVL